RKAAYLDEIEFIPVPEEAARVAGLQAGDYNYLEEIIPDQIAVLQDYPGVTIEILPPRSYGIIIMNTAGGMFTDQTLRQAVQAAIGVEASGQATHGEGYFEPGPGIMLPQTMWASDVSAELYNQNNPEKSAQLLQEAGYDGTPIRLLCTEEDLGDYNAAVVAQQQLEQAGFTVELEVTDEATLEENLEDDERWDMTTNAIVFRARYAALEELQRLFYEQAPMVKLVNNYGVAALSSNVQGLLGRMHFELEPEFTNCWLEEA
ncbi:MAG: extracellular solute-binding protein family 5, partial [Thermomicrobiales bacterium]|nr:extracellular solute-binding protein family 5 [Thermomicrobiales bacterium]